MWGRTPPPVPIANMAVSESEEETKTNSSVCFWITVVSSILVIAITSYYCFKHLFSYMGSRAYAVSMRVQNANQTQIIRAGETIALKLSFTKLRDNEEPVLVTPTELELINSHLVLDFGQEVGVLRTTTQSKDGLIIRFSMRRTGNYTLSCYYWRYHFVQSPLTFDVSPGPISIKRTVLEIQNPESIPVVVDTWTLIPVIGYDRFGNVCQIEEGLVSKFGILVKNTHQSVSDYTDSPELEWKFGLEGTKLFLQLKTKNARIFKCLLTFQGVPIEQSVQSFIVISLNLSEEHLYRTGVSSYSSPGWYATLEFMGIDSQESPAIYVSIAQKIVSISHVLVAGIVFNPMLAFYINRRTKISLVGSQSLDNKEKEVNVFLKVSDGIQNSVTFALSSTQARVLLATFGHVKGEKLKRSSFDDKKKALIEEIGPGLFGFFKNSFIMEVDKGNILASSIAVTPTTTKEWLRRFSISIAVVARSSPTSTPTSSQGALVEIRAIITRPNAMSTDVWLTSVAEALFEVTDGTGLFVKNSGSQRFHPNLTTRRKPRWTLKEMEFAGSIVGKYISDSLNYGICVNLTYLSFSKSFLASLIGVPVTYRQFESDYPSFYDKHIKKVLDNKSDKLSLKFETPKGFESEGKNSSAENIALIPNGNNIGVTQQNKIHYLNLLALHILKNRYELEIASFRSGFYKLIPQGLVADFDVDQLEALMCGGGAAFSFDIEDLKANHRLVGDLLDHAGLSDTDLPRYNFSQEEQGKILRWFWITLTNLSSQERTTLLKNVTGSTALPTCGFKDLSPKFTISLTGGYNQKPRYHPVSHCIAIGNHSNFDRFEKNIIESLYEEKEIEILDTDRNENQDERQELNSPTTSDTEFGLEIATYGQGTAATRYCVIT